MLPSPQFPLQTSHVKLRAVTNSSHVPYGFLHLDKINIQTIPSYAIQAS